MKRSEKTHRMRYAAGRGSRSRTLLVPARLAALIPDDAEFRPELTAEGILYRVVNPGTPRALPEWVQRGEAP